MVLVFDEKGEQVTEYQGYYGEVKKSVIVNAAADTLFNHTGNAGSGLIPVTQEAW